MQLDPNFEDVVAPLSTLTPQTSTECNVMRSDMDHTVLPANYTMPECGGEHLIAAHYSFIDPERIKG